MKSFVAAAAEAESAAGDSSVHVPAGATANIYLLLRDPGPRGYLARLGVRRGDRLREALVQAGFEPQRVVIHSGEPPAYFARVCDIDTDARVSQAALDDVAAAQPR